MEIKTSTICKTAAGVIGIAAEIDNGNAKFFPYAPDKTTGEYLTVPLTSLTVCTVDEVLSVRAELTADQLADIGYPRGGKNAAPTEQQAE